MLFTIESGLVSQESQSWQAGVYVDGDGVLRWNGSNQEVSLFGVNYTTPFAYSYRAHKRLGLSLRNAIDLDVAQMVRLGFDAFRVHVWDREISDERGNLLRNEHLDLFDYLLAKLAERGIKSIVTPIAWWGNGWPEPDQPTRGFSQLYSKGELITNEKAREAQRNYLKQFIEHVNPYRKLAYKNEPSVIAVEIINEPHHPDNEQATIDYINEMVSILRSAGYQKPIFYNISENWSNVQANAVTKANVEGISFQWYPTGLVHGKMLQGNYLINVNKYAIPSNSVVGFDKKAKMVYEFDAADVGASYMYPAMARSYREAGMQFAAMFSYDPSQIAWSNTEYPTHFLNLLYTPSKALSLMIAGKAFRELPRMKSYGSFPENNHFGDFRVSFEEDLSMMNTATEFVYSNTTRDIPKSIDSLSHVAGCGNSSVVQFDGTGAYFLDKQEKGIWRLEVYPDVLWLRDPFGVTSMSREVARLFWNQRKIHIDIPDLGQDYSFHSLSAIGSYTAATSDSGQLVSPGIYLVTAKSANVRKIRKYLTPKEPFLSGLYTPAPVSPEVYVVNKTSPSVFESSSNPFTIEIASEKEISSADLYVKRSTWGRFTKIELKNVGGFYFLPADTSKMMQPGELEYCVTVVAGGDTLTIPGGVHGSPQQWDFSLENPWTVRILKSGEPIVLLDAERDRKDFVFPNFTPSMRFFPDYKEGSNSENISLSLSVSFLKEDSIPFGIQLALPQLATSLARGLRGYRHVSVEARTTRDTTCPIGIVFLMNDGKSFKCDVNVSHSWKRVELPISSFQRSSALILPNSYPLFLPKTWGGQPNLRYSALDVGQIQSLQVVLDPSAVNTPNAQKEAEVEIVSVSLLQ